MTMNRGWNQDEMSDNQVVISEIHHEIHQGYSFFIKGVIDTLAAASDTAFFMFDTPSEKGIHAKVQFSSNAEYKVVIWEGCTVAATGTTITGFNMNRICSNEPLLKSYYGPTIANTATSLGTKLWETRIGSGKSPSGVALVLNYEIITKKNTKYIFEIQKVVVGAGYIDYDFSWYENGPKA